MRKYMRAIARQRMKAAGIERMNKPTLIIARIFRRGPSYFSQHWREYLGPDRKKTAKRRRLRKA